MMLAEGYNPRTWRTHALHMLPPEADEFSWDDPRTIACLDWIFLISSLNFSFWSEKCGSERYGVQWREPSTSGEKDGERVQVFTGYRTLLAAINKGPFECGLLDDRFWLTSSMCTISSNSCVHEQPWKKIYHLLTPSFIRFVRMKQSRTYFVLRPDVRKQYLF